MSNSSDAAKLILVTRLYSTYLTNIIFGLGLIGSLLNLLVFTNLKTFRHNRCAFYLVMESIVDVVQLIHMLFNETWKSTINHVEPMNISLVWCKLRTVVAQWCRLMLTAIICFVAIDQFFSTNHRVHLRRFSSLKLAERQMYFASLVCLLHTIPFVIFQEIRPSFGCTITNTALTNYYTLFYYPILTGLIPILVSSLFSILAYRNVRRLIQRQIPITRRRLDQQLTAMIFIRIIVHVILSLPYTVYRIYSLTIRINETDEYQYALNQLIHLVVTSMIYLDHGANFYIFFITSSRYRRQVRYFSRKICWQSIKRFCHCCHNTVQPLGRVMIRNDH